MYNANRSGNRFGNGRDFHRQSFGRRDPSDRPMFRTTCSKCGNDCEVPFRPTDERPVYCSKCFEHNRGTDSRRFEERDTRGNSDGQLKKQFETLNWKLDKILKIISPDTASTVIVTGKKPEHLEVRNPEPTGSRAKKSTKKTKKEKISVE